MAKVLLVEDDNNLREIYQARLMAEGYDIVAAQDGEEALVSAKKEHPDLIISDVMMPRISGFEMLDILRNTDELKNTKVIMLTALGQAEDQTRADNLGADRYLVKSQVTLEDIVKSAQELLQETGALPAPSAAPEASATHPSTPPAAQAPVVEAAPAPVAEPTPTPASVPAAPVAATPAPTPVTPPSPTPAVAVVPAPVTVEPVVIPAPVPAAPVIPEPVAPVMPNPEPVVEPEATQAPVVEAAPAPVAEPTPTPASVPAAPVAATPAPTPDPVTDTEPAPNPVTAPEPQQAATEPTVPSTAENAAVDATEPQTLEAEEAAIAEQINGFAEAPVEPTQSPEQVNDDAVMAKAVDTLVSSTTPPPAEASAPEPEPATPPIVAPPVVPPPIPGPKPASEESARENVTVAGKKVISPITAAAGTPSLEELLAKEAAKSDAGVVAEAPAVPVINGQPAAPAAQGFDPNSISL